MLLGDGVVIEVGVGGLCCAAGILGAFTLLGFYVLGSLVGGRVSVLATHVGGQVSVLAAHVGELKETIQRHDERLYGVDTRMAVLSAKLDGNGPRQRMED